MSAKSSGSVKPTGIYFKAQKRASLRDKLKFSLHSISSRVPVSPLGGVFPLAANDDELVSGPQEPQVDSNSDVSRSLTRTPPISLLFF